MKTKGLIYGLVFSLILLLGIGVMEQGDVWAGTVDLPQTGQTKCYSSYSSSPCYEIICADSGQDGESRAGGAWPNPRFTITYCNASGPCANQSSDCDGNASTDVVTDSLTGLMWTKDGNLTGTMTWNSAIDYANNLTLCGYSDWHLPNINELESLINANDPYTDMWLKTQGFYNVQSYRYWSSTTDASDSSFAWSISMYMYGWYTGVVPLWKSWDMNVLPVHSGELGGIISLPQTGQKASYYAGDDGDLERGVDWPSPRFTDNSNGTVIDNLTGLIWLKDANCIETQYPFFDNDSDWGGVYDGRVTWEHALDFVKGINNGTYSNCGAGYTDWKLPNRKELRSLVDHANYNPALPSNHPFINVQFSDISYSYLKYWSSTTYMDIVWKVDIPWSGYMEGSERMCSCLYYVWPVRSGHSGLFDYYCDDDNDGYMDSSIHGDGLCMGDGCVPVGCQTTPGDDCDDSNPSVNPGATEIPNNGIDDNCDGQIDDEEREPTRDDDGDGYSTPSSCGGTQNDCDDNDPSVNPGAIEVCDNQDNDCNPGTLDGSGDIWYGSACDGPDTDLCNEGIYQCTSGSQTCSDTTGDNIEVCDGIDNNCDGQTDEGNVCGVPDLLVSSWTAPANACANATISIKDTTKNQGTGTAGASQTCLYFSTNTTLDAGDTPLGCRAIPSLGAGAVNTGTTSVTLPNVTIGKYYLIVMADDGKVVTESNETNNKKSKTIYIGPDLYVSALSAPTSATLDATIFITDTTKNKGCGTAGASTIAIYLSTNTTINIGVDYELGTRPVPSLGTNAVSTGTTSVVIPAGIPTGKYYIIANSDDAKVVVEGNEGNNKKTKAITINP